MTVLIRTITIDCKEPHPLSLFWSQVTGFGEKPDDPNLPEQDEAFLLAPEGTPNLLFIQVPEGKQVKNRVHLDVVPPDFGPAARDAELARILDLGATVAWDQRRPDGTGWVVLADPEGNEFCLEYRVQPG
jgi:hypothetical protein